MEGVGELIVGYRPKQVNTQSQGQKLKLRRAFLVDGLINRDSTNNLGQVLGDAGGFTVDCFHQNNQHWSDIRGELEKFIQTFEEFNSQGDTKLGRVKHIPTCLLYLRGCVKETEDGEGRLILGNGVYLSRCFLRKILRQARKTQQIVILNLVSPDSGQSFAQNWIEDLQYSTEYGQCLIVTQTSIHKSEDFSQVLVESLTSSNPQFGLSVARWITQIQQRLQNQDIQLNSWFSGTQAVIDILPGGIDEVFPQVKPHQPQNTVVKIPDTVPALPKPVNKVEIPLPISQGLVLSSQSYAQLEALLKQLIGIIAPAVLQQFIEKSANNQELIENLTELISLQQKTQFKNQAKAILEIEEINAQAQLAKSPVALEPTIDDTLIKKCQQDLIYLIGPIANFIIEEILQSNPQISVSEFIDRLSQKVPDSGMAEKFKQRILKSKE
ncbi:MAG: hypothetical protein MJK14_01545 [Rivularia sp. ALOHA_DT_140]|nr:hypothetical protein [Rivularia sp. ALOHA_DT_140]